MDEANGAWTSGQTDPTAALALVSVAPVDLTDGEVTDGLLALITLVGQVQAAAARFADSFDSRCLATIDGARSTAGWLAARTELGRPMAVGAVATGRGLRHCPVVDRAAAQGLLGTAKVRLLLDARQGIEDLFGDYEEQLVAKVAPLTVEQAKRTIDQWRRVALATAGKDDGPEPADDVDSNAVHLSPTFQGRWRLDGDLDALTGTELAGALDHWIDTRIREGVLDPTDRKRSSLRAQALAALVGLGAQTGSSRTQPRARVAISWDAADLLGQPVADLAELDHRRCVTDRGTGLSRLAADQALCNADVVDLLTVFGLDGSRTVLGVTHTRRHPTARERAALAERDRGCVFPGCDAPAHWCDSHHTVPYEIGHRTRLDELVLLCPHHHRQVHRGFTLARSTTGHIHVARPDGTRLSPEPPGVASHADPRHKLPPPPTRFAPGADRSGSPRTYEPEPFDPVYEADVDARIRQRLHDLTSPHAA